QLGLQAVALGQERENSNAAQLFGAQLMLLRREQGRLEELVDLVKGLTERFPTAPSWQCGLAWVCAGAGREAEAREVIERLGHAGFADLPRDYLWSISVWQLRSEEHTSELQSRENLVCR